MRLSPGKYDKYLSFREDFRSLKSVADNGGVVVGGSVADGKYTGDGTTAKYVYYTNGKQIFGNKWTVRIKFKLNSINGSFSALLAKDVAGSRAFVLGVDSANKPYMENYPAGSGTPTGVSALSLGEVYDILYTSDGSATRVFVNGVQNGTTGAVNVVPWVGNNMTIGRRNYSGNERSADGDIYLVEVYNGVALGAEEHLDLMAQDTYSEVDLSKALVYLPLKSWYHKENGTQLLADGGMEAADTSAWQAYGGSTLTKETASPHSGTRNLRCAGSAANAGARQTILASGRKYRVTGWARGDGTVKPRILVGGASVTWEGTSSTSWQEFFIEAVADGAIIYLSQGVSAAGFVEFDDVNVQLMEAQTENKGTLDGVAYLGDKTTTTTFPTQLSPHGMSFDGGDYIDVESGIGPLLTLSSQFTFSVLLYDPSGLSDASGYSLGGNWDTAQNKGILFYKYPSASYGPGVIIGSSSGNFIEARGNEAPSGIHLYTFTYDGSGTFAGLKIYIDGKLSSWINGSTGTLGSDIVSGKGFIVGARWNGAASPHQFLTSGKRIYGTSLYQFVLTPSQIRWLHKQLLSTLNV